MIAAATTTAHFLSDVVFNFPQLIFSINQLDKYLGIPINDTMVSAFLTKGKSS